LRHGCEIVEIDTRNPGTSRTELASTVG